MDRRRFMFTSMATSLGVTANPESCILKAMLSGDEVARLQACCERGVYQRLEARRELPLTNDEQTLYSHRLKMELQAIDTQHLTSAFLQLGEIQAYLRECGLYSVILSGLAGSLVAYSLGLTPVCPIRCGLRFDDPICLGENRRSCIYAQMAGTSLQAIRFLADNRQFRGLVIAPTTTITNQYTKPSSVELRLTRNFRIRFVVTKRLSFIQAAAEHLGIGQSSFHPFDLPSETMEASIRSSTKNVLENDYPLVSSTLMHRWRQSEPMTLDDVALLVAEDYATARGQQIEAAEFGSTGETRQRKFVDANASGSRTQLLMFRDDLVDILERASGLSRNRCWKRLAEKKVDYLDVAQRPLERRETNAFSTQYYQPLLDDLVHSYRFALAKSHAYGEAFISSIIRALHKNLFEMARF